MHKPGPRWGDWSVDGTIESAFCTVSCGGGFQQRVRSIAVQAADGGQPANGPESESPPPPGGFLVLYGVYRVTAVDTQRSLEEVGQTSAFWTGLVLREGPSSPVAASRT